MEICIDIKGLSVSRNTFHLENSSEKGLSHVRYREEYSEREVKALHSRFMFYKIVANMEIANAEKGGV